MKNLFILILCFLSVNLFAASFDETLKKAKQGDVDSQYELYNIYNKGIGVSPDMSKATEWLTKAAEQGHKSSQRLLGIYYLNGIGVEKNRAKGIEWWEKLGEQDVAYQYRLAADLEQGTSGYQDEDKANEWYRKAAERGFSAAQGTVGFKYTTGEFGFDFKKAREWFEKCADQGDIACMYGLADIYRTGNSVRPDYKKAKELYNKVCEAGIPDACEQHAKLVRQGH